MALDDGGLKADTHFLEPITCGAENLSPFSNTSGFSDNSTYYSADYDWQQQEQQQQQHQQQQQPPTHHQLQPPPQQQQQQPQLHPHHLQPHHHIHESSLRYYGTFPDSVDMAANGYPNFGAHGLAQSDYFPNNHALWTTVGQHGDPLCSNAMTSSHSRFFSGVDLSQHVGVVSSQMPANTPSSGKPKRKRVQSHTQRKAANVRERRRMFHLNEAFDELRKRLPAFNYEKRLSRIETLRLAMTYISFMKEVSVGMDPKCVKLKPHGADLSGLPMSLTAALTSGLKHGAYAGMESTDEGTAIDSDDCSSNDVHSLHSA